MTPNPPSIPVKEICKCGCCESEHGCPCCDCDKNGYIIPQQTSESDLDLHYCELCNITHHRGIHKKDTSESQIKEKVMEILTSLYETGVNDGKHDIKYFPKPIEFKANQILSLLSSQEARVREEAEWKVWEKVRKGLKVWAKLSESHKWLSFGSKPKDWYDADEVLSSLLSHAGYWSFLDSLSKDSQDIKGEK